MEVVHKCSVKTAVCCQGSNSLVQNQNRQTKLEESGGGVRHSTVCCGIRIFPYLLLFPFFKILLTVRLFGTTVHKCVWVLGQLTNTVLGFYVNCCFVTTFCVKVLRCTRKFVCFIQETLEAATECSCISKLIGVASVLLDRGCGCLSHICGYSFWILLSQLWFSSILLWMPFCCGLISYC